jgi:hypothetical protein
MEQMTGREEAGLRGSVRECITETEFQSGVGVTTRSFSRDGRLLEARHRNPDGSEWFAKYRYTDGGRLLEREYGGGIEPAGDRLLSYEYDSAGKLQRVTARNGDGDERVAESHRYEPNGEHMVTEYPDPALQARGVQSSTSNMLRRTADMVAALTYFDIAGLPVKRVLYDGNDMVIRRVLIRHDRQGRIVEEGEAEPGGTIRKDFRHLYSYDDQGRKIEVDMHWYDLGGQRITTSYNERGDIAEERTLSRRSSIDLGLGEKDVEWLERHEYAYDACGNWVSRTSTTHSPPDAEGTQVRTERRRIEYWED